MDLAAIATSLRTAADLALDGVSRLSIARAVTDGRLVVVRRGWYVDATVWSQWFAESRVAARAIATARSMRDGAVASSHTDALVLHGLPLHRFTPTRAHVTGPHANGGTGHAGVARHRGLLAGDVVSIAGLAVTSLPRTIADVIGRLPLTAAVAAADGALRHVAWRGGADPYDADADAHFRAEVRACAALRPGAPRRVQAEWVLSFADGRAQLPGESATRVHLHRLGFATPRLQVRIDLPHGGWYDIDFGLDDIGAWVEFDGTGKYTDPLWRGGRDSAQVVLDEKHREDLIRGMTGRPLLRVGTAHIGSAESLRQRLAIFNALAPLRRPRPLPVSRAAAL